MICASCGEPAVPAFAGCLCVLCWNRMHGRVQGSILSSRSLGAACEREREDDPFWLEASGRLRALVVAQQVIDSPEVR